MGMSFKIALCEKIVCPHCGEFIEHKQWSEEEIDFGKSCSVNKRLSALYHCKDKANEDDRVLLTAEQLRELKPHMEKAKEEWIRSRADYMDWFAEIVETRNDYDVLLWYS